MLETIKRIVVVVVMAACLGLLFVGSHDVSAETISNQENTEQWAWPVIGTITDTFGSRHGSHRGLDIAAPFGDKIYAVIEGKVKKSYYSSSSYGNVIFIEHPNGYETVYAHLSKRSVEEGDMVERGQIIGDIGSTGRSTGPHLHFEVHNGEWNSARNNAINPLTILTDEPVLITTKIEEEKERQSQLKLTLSKGYNYQEPNHIENEETLVGNIEVANMQNNEEAVTNITIDKGQTLWDISKQYNVTIDSLMTWNQLDSSLLLVGQSLDIYHNKEKTYVVKEGESLSVIANHYGMSVNELKALNNLTEDLIFPMQVLIIEKS
ncbi:M23 family metallopeptidase [Ferdinandcohnia quinoae]|uniref:Peptidoglycan DD-metalloendopeptidase family protein n=1 Tax=Fredinandcohnia quinoae TaxID=2918902 RepID=A0AAW5E7M5_9BACI|nr:M23 family metallopeptidase [Fredinandcohnia sp. SECRCQ15]MCH1624789.1 peptidoglycan DD-metalloendopeptidase family protein [Fredinandcohnia sp. SECRCQ15]